MPPQMGSGEDPSDALSLQVTFRKRATNYKALLRKMTNEVDTRWGVVKTHRMPCLYRPFSAKEPLLIWLFYGKSPMRWIHDAPLLF